jgi:GNAT superfamily N-acetyltransferase
VISARELSRLTHWSYVMPVASASFTSASRDFPQDSSPPQRSSVGFDSPLQQDDQLLLADVHVEPEYRRRGIGRLLAVVVEAADRAGIRKICGKVTAEDLRNTRGLLEWYQRHGFIVTDPGDPRGLVRWR